MHRKQATAMAYKFSVVQVANIRATSERTHWFTSEDIQPLQAESGGKKSQENKPIL
jgi:hypothetical protein